MSTNRSLRILVVVDSEIKEMKLEQKRKEEERDRREGERDREIEKLKAVHTEQAADPSVTVQNAAPEANSPPMETSGHIPVPAAAAQPYTSLFHSEIFPDPHRQKAPAAACTVDNKAQACHSAGDSGASPQGISVLESDTLLEQSQKLDTLKM